jgi:hypothetical protein
MIKICSLLIFDELTNILFVSCVQIVESKRMEIGDAVIVDADKNEVKTEHEDLEALPDDVVCITYNFF